MSKYGKVVGEALIRVSPTTELFHNKLNKEVEKLNKKKKPQIDIPLVVDSEEAERELKKFGELADVLDGRILRVKVELDDAEARAGINRLIRDTEDRSFTINGKMDVNDDSLREANEKLRNFREENNMMDVWAVTRTEGAERSMHEFRKRFEEMVISPKITPEYGAGKKRNPIVDEEWNSINMIPKLYSKMHAQFEKGIRQVYDPYLKTLGKFYNATAQPFRNFRKMANEAETAAHFFDKLSDSIIDFDSKLKKNLAPAAKIFRRMGDEAAKVSVPIKFLGSGMKAASAKFRDAAKGFSNDNKKIWTPTFKSMRLNISGLSSAWETVAEKANKSTEGMFSNFSTRAKRAGSEASSSILDLFRNVGRGVSLDLSGTLDGFIKKFSKSTKLNFGEAFQGVGEEISETIEGLGELVPYLGDTEEGINRTSRAWGRFRRSAESSISGVARALRKFSSSVWGEFANKTLSSLGDKLLGVVDEVDSRTRRMRGLFKLQLGFITEDITAFTDRHKRTFRAIFGAIGEDFKALSEGARKELKDMWVVFNLGLVLAQVDAKAALGKLKKRFAGFGFDVSGIFSRLKEHMGRDIYDFAPKAIEASKSAQLAITEFARSASTDLAIISGSSKRGRFSGMFDGLIAEVDSRTRRMRGLFKLQLGFITEDITAFTDRHKRTFRAIFGAIGEDFKALSEGARKELKDMWVVFNLGLVLAQVDAKAALGKLKKRFAGFGFDVSGIFSRLKEHMGRDIYDFAPKAIEASKSAQLAITEFARSASTDLAIISGSSKRGRFSGMFDGLKESVDGAFGGLRGYLKDGLDRLREYYPDLTRLRDRLSAVTDAMRRLGSQASSVFGGMSLNVKGLTRGFRGFRLTAGGAFDGISEKVGGIGSSFRNLSSQAGDAFSGAFDKVKVISGGKSNDILKGMTTPFERFGFSASDKFRKGMGQPFGDFFKRSRPVISQGFGKMGTQFQKGAGKVRGIFGKSVAGMGGLLSKGLGRAMNSKKLWSGVTKGMTRFSNIAMGGARIAIGAFTILGSTIMKSVVPALGAAAIGIGMIAGKVAIAGVLALAGAIYSVAQGAVLMVPALAAAAGISFMALKFGLEGVKDAVGQALSAETAEEFEEAMSGVPASVQGVARALRSFKPAIDEMKRATQDNLLADLGPSLSSAVGNLLPTLSQGLQSVATEWNGALKLAMAELASPEAASGLQAITDGTTAMAREMQPTLSHLIAGMGQLAEAGAQYLEPLGKWINDSAEGFREWTAEFTKIDEATGLSRFQVVIQDAIRNAGYLRDIFGGLFGAIGNILTASQRGGGGMLASMGGGMRKLQEYTAEGSEGFDKIVGFMQEASDLAELLGDLLSPVMSIILDLTTALASVGVGAMPGITKFAEGLAGGLAPVTAIAETFGADLGSGVESLSGFAGSLGGTLAPLLGGLGGGLSSALKGAGAGLDVVSEPLRKAATAMQPVLEKVGSALGKIFESAGPVIAGSLDMIAAMAPVLGEVATQIGDVASALLDAIGPIFEENDDFLISLAENAKSLVVILGENLVSTINFLAPIVQWLAAAFYGVMEAMTPFLPIIASIGSVVVIVGTGIALLAKAFGPLVTIIKTARTVWSLLSLAFTMSPIGMLILAIAGLATGLYLFFSKTETGRKMWKTMTDAVADGWDWLMDKLKSGWDWVVDKVFNPMREWASGIQDDFKNMVEGIKDKFESLKKIFADPIEHLINPIWNNTMVPLSEKIHSVIPAIPVFERAGMAFAQGGVLPGYSPGVDNYHFVNPSTGQNLHLSGGEAVMRPEWTRAVGGPAAVEEMNRRAIRGDLKPTKHHKHADGGTLAFAGGGIIGSMIDIVSRKYPQLQMTSGQRPGGGLHGAGMATDWSNGSGNTPAQLALAQDIAQTYPGSAELIYDAPGWSGNIKNGANVGAFGEFYTMAQAGRHDHHVHWGMNTPPTMPFGGGVFEGGSDGSGGGQSLWERAKAFAAKIWDQVTGFFSNSWSKVTSGFGNLGGGFLGDMVKGYATSAFDGLKAQAKKLIPNLSGGGESVDVSDITGPVVDQVKQVFERHGFTGAEWDAAKWIIQQESSWSPTAVNPSSGAFGLFQFNPMGGDTLGEYLPSRSTDPAVQADAGARYMRNRYGTPTAAKAFWEANQWYDQGGEARGIGVMQKNVLSPERVLSPAQTKAFNDFVYDFMPALIETWRKNPMEIRNGLAAVQGEIKRSAKLIAEEREVKISGMTRAAKSMFVAEIEGTKELNKVDTATLMKLDPRDHKSIRSWVDANGKTLETNLTGAARMVAQIAPDPKAYLEAEKRAKEAIDKDREEAREKASEEAKKKSQEAKEKEREAKREKEKAEDEAAKTDEEREALKQAREAAEEAESKSEQERSAAEQEAERKEDERIEALKATGEYYYGYKTFGDQGENPNAREVPEHERVAQDTMKNIAGRVGLGGVADKAFSIYRMVESIGQSVETAIPSWLAAANGDYAGLNHNVAVSSSLALDSAQQEATALIPTLAGDVFEALVARNTQAPMYGSFIENVYTGMSKGEFNQAIEEYQARSARKGTGTNRPR